MDRIEKVQIETIHDCNGKCRICNYKDTGRPRVPEQMVPWVFTDILKQIQQLPNLKTICPYNHNDPLLDPLIWSRILQIRTSFPNVRVELSTNGIALCSWNTGYFCQLVHDKWISFHGIDRETYELNMGISWKNGLKVQNIIKGHPNDFFTISCGLAGFTEEQAIDFWKDYDNVGVMTFIPRDRAGNIQSDACRSFDNPPGKNFDCWRFNLFLVYNTQGKLIPCSNDLQEMYSVGHFMMNIEELIKEREDFRRFNRSGEQTICGRCEDHD